MDAFIAPFDGDCTPWVPIAESVVEINNQALDVIDTTTNTIALSPLGSFINIFPNPFANKIQIGFSVNKDETPVSIVITDMPGKPVFEQTSTFGSGDQLLNVPINSSASLYIVKVCVGNQCNIQKIVKHATN